MGKKPRSKAKIGGKAGLLDGDWFSHEAEAALEKVFYRFDVDRDRALSEKELQAFAKACNDGTPFDTEELAEIKKYFEVNDADALTHKGFFQLYHTQTVARPADTWKDLRALGFDSRLQIAEETPSQPPTSRSDAASSAKTADAGEDAPSLQAHCARSDQLYTDGDHKESLRAAMAAIALDDQCADAHRCAGRALFALGRAEAAERSWLRANELANCALPTALDELRSAGDAAKDDGVKGEAATARGDAAKDSTEAKSTTSVVGSDPPEVS